MACSITRRLLYRNISNIYERFNSTSYPCVTNFLCKTSPRKSVYYETYMVQFVYPFQCKHFSTTSQVNKNINEDRREETDHEKEKELGKLTLFQKFKKMYRDYWYVLVPVHLVSSAAWFGSFYYMAKR